MQPPSPVIAADALTCLLTMARAVRRRRRQHRQPDREWLKILLERLNRMAKR